MRCGHGSKIMWGQCPGLAGYLARVPGPRNRRGVRHSLTSLLTAAVAEVLAGATSSAAVGGWVADAPPQVLAALGARRDPLTRRLLPPDEAAIRRVLEAADAGQQDAAVGSWLDGRLHAAGQAAGHGRRRRRAVADGGKAVRGTRHASAGGQPVHLPAALDQRCGAVPGQVRADGRTSEITRFAPLLEPLDLAGCVITADALHTQREHAEFLAAGKGAHYTLVVNKNQPGLYARVKNLPCRPRPALADGEGADVARARSGDPRGHQGLEGIGPQAIGTAGEVPLLEVCTSGVVHDL